MDHRLGRRYRPPMEFICPICASINWREVVVPKGTGYYKTDFAECCGCSAILRRPELFTVGRGASARRRRRPTGNHR